jgi:hypothetical protein
MMGARVDAWSISMPRYIAYALLLFVPTTGADAATVGPTWSEVTGIQYSKAGMNRAPAIIKSIDGRSTLYKSTKVEPGLRKVGVESPSRKGFKGYEIVLELGLEPCKRYYINTQFASGSGTEWRPVVDKVETIPGCKVPPAAKQ